MTAKTIYNGRASFMLVAGAIGVLLLLSCGTPTDSTDTDSARVVWGEHIEGIRIGDDSTTVVQKLGPPDNKLMGDFAGWIFHYEKPPYNSISVMISNDGALHSGVYSIMVAPPYEETTKEGVRLGMTREETLKYLPPPNSSLPLSKGRIRDVYYYKKNTFFVLYNEEEIMISMGIQIPSSDY